MAKKSLVEEIAEKKAETTKVETASTVQVEMTEKEKEEFVQFKLDQEKKVKEEEVKTQLDDEMKKIIRMTLNYSHRINDTTYGPGSVGVPRYHVGLLLSQEHNKMMADLKTMQAGNHLMEIIGRGVTKVVQDEMNRG